MSITVNELPNTLSELLKLALNDFEKCEADPEYVINMRIFLSKMSDGPCFVCLAGSMLAQSCGMRNLGQWNTLSDSLKRKLNAIDWLRHGDIKSAYEELYGVSNEFKYFDIHDYRIYPEEFKKDMRELLNYLIDIGV